jgi:transcriptional regulator with XRE-family HTH domain
MKKVTIHDIAQKAGVSVATVSYVINNRTDQKISEATKKKVLQIINLLNYTPNQSAQTLATSKSRNIGIRFSAEVSNLKKSEYMFFLDELSNILNINKYNLIYLNSNYCEKINNIDALLCYDLSRKQFYELGDKNFIPLIAIDCLINDSVFFQIITDFKRVKIAADDYFKKEKYTLVCLKPENTELEIQINSIFTDIIYLSDYDSIKIFKNDKINNILIINKAVHQLLYSYQYNIFYSDNFSNQKFQKIIECIECSVNKITCSSHNFPI